MQISKNKLDKNLEIEMFNQFWYYLGKINNSHKSFDFFSDFFTNTEKIAFAKRFFTAILLTRGKTFYEIRNALHISSSTVLGVSSWIKNAKPETQKILKAISIEKNIENMSDKIDELLDKLPPKVYTNWSNELKMKNERISNRTIKQILR